MRKNERIEIFVEEIWRWYERHKRILPWRDLPDDDLSRKAYAVLVSEIMLQQTQVERVKAAFTRFLRSFPDLAALAGASNADVIRAWSGMGYNARALRLRDACRTILSDHGGRFPDHMSALLSIKGIGPYTAAAIRNFAFDRATPCIDTNIRRVYHRVFFGPEKSDGSWSRGDDVLLVLADEILSAAVDPKKKTGSIVHSAAEWHAALMDYGSLVCTKRSPAWNVCPLTARGICKAAYRIPVQEKTVKKERGRTVGGVFVPDRIFRGRVVEQLRQNDSLSFDEIGSLISCDHAAEHHGWLDDLLVKLERDRLIVSCGGRYALSH